MKKLSLRDCERAVLYYAKVFRDRGSPYDTELRVAVDMLRRAEAERKA